jgi:hypothetical protein
VSGRIIDAALYNENDGKVVVKGNPCLRQFTVNEPPFILGVR